MAASMKECHIQSREVTEALAIFKGIQLYLHLGLSHLVVKSDCQSMILMLQDAVDSNSPLGNIIHEIKALQVYFYRVLFNFVFARATMLLTAWLSLLGLLSLL